MSVQARVPRLLVTIPHFFKEGSDSRYGSGREKAAHRVNAIRRCITALHQSLGSRQAVIQVGDRVTHPVRPVQRVELDIVVCTAGDNHLLAGLEGLFSQERTGIADPMLLGYECQRAMKERAGRYDWYAYMEDDLIVTDPWFLAKLAWFQRHAGAGALLQPNRFEIAGGPLHKLYLDGDFSETFVRQFLPREQETELKANFLDVDVRLVRARNPHAGAYFLTAGQLEYWMGRTSFLDYETSFFGPLESAATFGVMRTFQTYKPHMDNAAFLEIQHHGNTFMSYVGTKFPMQDELSA
ncbi:hypothetical protein [Niveispirillum sp. KHB5.9]|uniref:hypothetical protein n=1 Tax=Niveispirillum sp. KHB5.9 TaxID=3400269 RepID=UPI003A862993